MEKQNPENDRSEIQERLPEDEHQSLAIVQQIRELVEEHKFKPALEQLTQFHPADQGYIIRNMPLELQRRLLLFLTRKQVALIFKHLEPVDAAGIVEEMDAGIISDILDDMDPDAAADILHELPSKLSRNLLDTMEEAKQVESLMQYPDDTAGGRMVLEFVSVKLDITAWKALNTLRLRSIEREDIPLVYVVDADNKLVGSIRISRLALARPGTRVKSIMNTELISIQVDANQEECARIMERYDLSELPGLDYEGKRVGGIPSRDVLDVIEQELAEDMYRLAGIYGERVSGPLLLSLKNRIPWLLVNLLTTFIAASVISVFESTIARVVTLAVFLPIVAGQGGIGGTQTLTLVVRSVVLREIEGRQAEWRLLVREVLLGLMHGLILGLIVGVVGFIWKGNPVLGLVLGLAMIGNMVIAGFTGAGIPLLLMRFGVDPAVASAVIVTTCTDVVGFFLFLGLATLLVNLL